MSIIMHYLTYDFVCVYARTIANYLMWGAVRRSLRYFTKDVRRIRLQLVKNFTGIKSETERWKTCIGKNGIAGIK